MVACIMLGTSICVVDDCVFDLWLENIRIDDCMLEPYAFELLRDANARRPWRPLLLATVAPSRGMRGS